MAIIKHLPDDFIREHANWHGRPHSGLEFLTFHCDFILRVLTWNRTGFRIGPGGLIFPGHVDPALLEPWTTVPHQLLVMPGAQAITTAIAEMREDPGQFRDDAALGHYIQSVAVFSLPQENGDTLTMPIHTWMHWMGAEAFGEEAFRRFPTSPHSTYFYQLHGLIQRWWMDWKAAVEAPECAGYREELRKLQLSGQLGTQASRDLAARIAARGCPVAPCQGFPAGTSWAAKYKAPEGAPGVPERLLQGETRTVSVTMVNTGDTTWTAAEGYALGAQDPAVNWGIARVGVPHDVKKGAPVTFTFPVTAPLTAGTYPFRWRMVRAGDRWFGERTPARTIGVGSPECLQLATNIAQVEVQVEVWRERLDDPDPDPPRSASEVEQLKRQIADGESKLTAWRLRAAELGC